MKNLPHSADLPSRLFPCLLEAGPAPERAIVCGTDFSEAAAQAVEVAAAFARRLLEPLILVHAVDDAPRGRLPGEVRDSLSRFARGRLDEERERLREAALEPITAFRAGSPPVALLDEAAAQRARLLVLAAGKRRGGVRRFSGGVAERVAEASDAVTLVVRDAGPLVDWLHGRRRLRVFVGVDCDAPSEAALRWVAWLRRLNPCDVSVACFAPGLAALSDDRDLAKAARLHERHFRKEVQRLLGPSRVRVRFEPGWGRSDAHFIQLAKEGRADLIVAGTKSDCGWRRAGHHAVSRGVLRYAPLNVACVPVRAAAVDDPISREPQPTFQILKP